MAWQIILDEGICSLPVNVGRLCRSLGISVRQYAGEDDSDGRSLIVDGRPLTLVSHLSTNDPSRPAILIIFRPCPSPSTGVGSFCSPERRLLMSWARYSVRAARACPSGGASLKSSLMVTPRYWARSWTLSTDGTRHTSHCP